MASYPVRTRRWTRAEYDRLIETGAFRSDERLELLGGQLVVREPQGSRHSVAIELASRVLLDAFGPGWRVRVQLPLALDGESEPEPDLSVVAGDPRASSSSHPPGAALVLEVAETSLQLDRWHKGGLYARAGIADYWIINLIDGVLEVYRDPVAMPTAPFGRRYADRQRHSPGASVCPLAAPTVRIAVADLLP